MKEAVKQDATPLQRQAQADVPRLSDRAQPDLSLTDLPPQVRERAAAVGLVGFLLFMNWRSKRIRANIRNTSR